MRGHTKPSRVYASLRAEFTPAEVEARVARAAAALREDIDIKALRERGFTWLEIERARRIAGRVRA